MKKSTIYVLFAVMIFCIACKEDEIIDDTQRQSPKLSILPDITEFSGKVGDVLEVKIKYENIDGNQRLANSLKLTKYENNRIVEEKELLDMSQKGKPFTTIEKEYSYTLIESEVGKSVRLVFTSEAELTTPSGGKVFSGTNKSISITTRN